MFSMHLVSPPISVPNFWIVKAHPPPAKSREKPARLGRRVRGLPLVVSSNHLAESVALPPIRGKASCPNLKAFRPPFHSPPCDEGVAIHISPESCPVTPEGLSEALTGGRHSQPL